MIRILALSALALAIAAPAFAQDSSNVAASGDTDVPSVRIRYSDADFADHASTAALYSRLRGAARQVCDVNDQSLAGMSRRMSCERQALDRAVAQIGRSELYAFRAPATGVGVASRGR
jgi:UrcA family protein